MWKVRLTFKIVCVLAESKSNTCWKTRSNETGTHSVGNPYNQCLEALMSWMFNPDKTGVLWVGPNSGLGNGLLPVVML